MQTSGKEGCSPSSGTSRVRSRRPRSRPPPPGTGLRRTRAGSRTRRRRRCRCRSRRSGRGTGAGEGGWRHPRRRACLGTTKSELQSCTAPKTNMSHIIFTVRNRVKKPVQIWEFTCRAGSVRLPKFRVSASFTKYRKSIRMGSNPPAPLRSPALNLLSQGCISSFFKKRKWENESSLPLPKKPLPEEGKHAKICSYPPTDVPAPTRAEIPIALGDFRW